jgi:O-antigen/teichoic acid export membrane protein
MLRVAIAVVTTVGLTAYLFRVHPFRMSLDMPLLRKELRYGVRNYAASLMWLALLQSDIILCNAFLGNAKTGIYSVAVSIATSTTVLPGAVAPLLFQRVSAEDSRERRIANTNHVLRIMTLVMVVAVIALGVAASWLVTLLYGGQYEDATQAIQMLCPGIFFASMANLVLSFLSGEGSPPVVYRAPLLGFLLNLGLNLYMIPTLGINGASITSTIGYFAAFSVLVYRYTRSTDSKASAMFVPSFADVAVAFRRTPE